MEKPNSPLYLTTLEVIANILIRLWLVIGVQVYMANNISVEELMAANPMITDKNAIVAGDTIAIPGVNVPRSSGFNLGRMLIGEGNTPDFIKGIEDRIKGQGDGG